MEKKSVYFYWLAILLALIITPSAKGETPEEYNKFLYDHLDFIKGEAMINSSAAQGEVVVGKQTIKLEEI